MQDFISYKSQITDFLTEFLKRKQQKQSVSYFSKDVFERILPLAISGKMLRGSLLINTFEKLSRKKFTQKALQAAVALELAQTGFLIHDDIIDRDELRRGQVTLQHQYAQRAQKRKYQQPEHAGVSLAICAGDIVFFLVYELLPTNLIKLFSLQFGMTALGEMHDVELALMSGKKVIKDDIWQMYLDKTASYSVCLPLMAGAVLADQHDEVLIQLNELGKILGLIFQIKDDELGLFGNTKATGKPVGADIREGKKTLYYYYLLQSTDDKTKIVKTFGKRDLNEKQAGEILSLMEEWEIEEIVKKDLGSLDTQASQRINDLSVLPEFKQMMFQFLDMVANRVR